MIIGEEAEFWLLAQKNDEQTVKEDQEAVTVVDKSWSAPPKGWLKCNIGVHRSREQKRCGAAWVLRNDKGNVLLHSRRAFSNIQSNEEANYQGLLWDWMGRGSHKRKKSQISVKSNSSIKKISR